MNQDELQYIVGKAEADKPAVIRFFSAVHAGSAERFKAEWEWLHDYVKPSKITVLINSEGGSVIHGMTIFSCIHNSEIPVTCIIEGIAASMGSVIWAAGDQLYMHDYSLLMIHNPFHSCAEESEDPDIQQQVNAFKTQLEIIYQKRFGLTKDEVRKIMDGAEGADGTFFTAKEAVKAGFLPSEHVIKTSKQVREKVKSEIENLENGQPMRDFMSAIAAEIDETKLLAGLEAIHNRNEESEINSQTQVINKMEPNDNTLFDTIFAQLGLTKDSQTAAVSARIAELMKAEGDLKETKAALDKATIDLAGKEAELANVTNELTETKAALQVYKDAEEAAHQAEVNAVIYDAIKAGKIEATAKEAWLGLAQTNFEHVKATLDSIQGRENITQAIAQDPANTEHIQDTLSDVEKEMKAKIEANLGKVEFETF